MAALVCVADVFRHQWQQDFPVAAFRHAPRQQVEEKKERSLPATSDRDILRAYLPAEGFTKKAGYRLQKPRIPTRRVIRGQRSVYPPVLSYQFHEPPPPYLLNRRNSRGLPPAQHFQVGPTAGHCMTEIIHQFFNPTPAPEVTAKLRKII